TNPSEEDVRNAISGVLCRCTGYKKPVEAVLQAAAILRGEQENYEFQPGSPIASTEPFERDDDPGLPTGGILETPGAVQTELKVLPDLKVEQKTGEYQQVGKPAPKVDAVKLAQGKPAFTGDYEIRGLLHAKVLRSPYAHALIKNIDTTKAEKLPGVAAVLTHKDVPRVAYSTAGQSDPIPGPLDCFSLDKKVRFVGDRVAFVAAETPEIAEKAIQLIEVDYEVIEPVLDMGQAMKPNAPVIHDEPDYVNFADSDPTKNLAAEIRIDIGDVETGFQDADHIFERDYEVPKVQQA
ncbi:MAG: xanthine dehydrogenase, partial [Gammaproteobacteria bacterium]|nr:xanthine dehydrogenase [Gammaproteobacteria bacterium]